MSYCKKIITLAIFVSFSTVASGVQAEETTAITNNQSDQTLLQLFRPSSANIDNANQLNFSSAQTASGFKADVYNHAFVLSALKDVWQGGANLKVGKSSNTNLPWKLKLAGNVYDYSLTGGTLAEGGVLTLELSYLEKSNFLKQAYYFDSVNNVWKALPSTDLVNEKKVRAILKFPVGKVAVFSDSSLMTSGKASWYSYKPGMYSASPDFPKGSKLRVTNLATGKSIEVTVNDWGPERDKHPDRVVDLSKEAFKALSPLSAGVINVSVSAIELAADRNGKVLGVKDEGIGPSPKLSARSAIIINDAGNQILFSKNPSAVMPLASLSKIVAVAVYLKAKPDLNAKMVYKKEDAAMNTLYAKASESAKVNLKDGDQVIAKDFVYAALVASANNAVESLVRNSGMTRDKFIAEMNSTVKSWGAKNTRLIEPTGLSSKNVSTAEDYAIIAREAYKNEVMRQASISPRYTIKVVNRKVSVKLTNTNTLIVDQAQENLKLGDLGINGSKTGFLNEAGYCLMTRVKSANGQFTIVTFGATSRKASFSEMMDLIKYANLKS